MIKDIKYNGIIYKVNNPGRIIKSDINHFIDQLSDKDTEVFTRSISKYLLDTYNLTTEEYFNIIMNDGVYPICPECGEPGKFLGISSGYKTKCRKCNSDLNLKYILRTAGICRCCGIELNENNSDNNSICYKCNGLNYDLNDRSVTLINGFKIYHYGKIAKKSFNSYLDQFDNSTVIYTRSKFLEYILRTYGLTEKEYYNIVVYGDIDYSVKCKNESCSNSSPFLNINNGYRSYCSAKCGISSLGNFDNFKSYYDRLNQTVEIRDNKRKKIFTKMSKNEIIALMYHGYRCYSGKYNDKYDKCYLYYAEFSYNPDIFKIGISVTPEDRWYKAGYLNPCILHTSSVEDIAHLEFNIKRNFVDLLVLESEYPTEIFMKSDYDKIFKFIDKLIN